MTSIDRRLAGLILALALVSSPLEAAKRDGIADEIRHQFAEFSRQHPALTPPLESDEFRHPAEVELIDTLMTRNPGIQDLVAETRQAQDEFVRERDRLYSLAAVQVGPTQYPEVHQIAVDTARSLGLSSNHKVFIVNDAETWGNVFGVPTHGHYGNSFGPFSLVLNAGLIKAMDPEELRFVIAREMGHVKANHRFYTAIAFRYQAKSKRMPRLNPDEQATDAPGLGGALLLFFGRGPQARRLSEYSADRAGIAATRDPEAAFRALAKLAAGDLQGVPGFDLEAFKQQVEQARRDLTSKDIASLVQSEGYVPYILSRVGELQRFAESQDFQRLVDRASVNPFLLEVETLQRIGTTLRRYTRQLERFRTSPRTERLDPLERDRIHHALVEAIDSRQAALTDLQELVAAQLKKVGLELENPYFDDMISSIERRKDAGPFTTVLANVNERIQFLLQRPDLPADHRERLEHRRGKIEAVRTLAPAVPADEEETDVWVETNDLSTMVNQVVAELSAAGQGDKAAFLASLESMKPRIRAASIDLVSRLTVDEKKSLADLVSRYGGKFSSLVTDILSAGNEPERLGSVFDTYFEEARRWARTIPMTVIRFGLEHLNRNEF